MKLWLLEPRLSEGNKYPENWERKWDMAYGFVVRAESEDDARTLASADHGDEESDAWTDPECSTCTELTAEGNLEIILRDFLAG